MTATPRTTDPIVPIPPATKLSYDQSAVLMNDFEFRGRVKVSVLEYAKYIMDEATNTPAHTSRLRWAQQTYQSPDAVAQQLQPPVVMDTAVQTAGSAIDDVALQSAVEGVVNKLL